MKISARSEYAVLALLYIYEEAPRVHEESGLQMGMTPISLRAICQRQSFPEALLRKVLQKMATAGILRSINGQHGGFFPRKPAAAVSLWDIVSLFEPRAYLNNCTTDTMLCLSQPTCRLAGAWQKAQAALDEQLRQITYASLLRAKPQGQVATGLTVLGLKSRRQLATSH